MSFEPLPPQVKAVCDGHDCGSELECDGITLYFNADGAAAEARNYGWEMVGGRLLCEDCRFVEEAAA